MALVIKHPTTTKVTVVNGPTKNIDLFYNRGESAYEVAVANGFQGTETEWLESLKATAEFEAALEQHVEAATPHPAYDDLPSMTLLFENGLI